MREQALRGLCYNVTAMPPRMFRSGLFVLGAALCGAVMAGRARPAQSTGETRPPSAGPHSEILLVFPFENASRMANLDWLDEGLSELTAERLEDRGVNVLSREDRLATLERIGLPDSARFSHATIIKIAGEADADAVVAFVTRQEDLDSAEQAVAAARTDRLAWISYPKGGRLGTDLNRDRLSPRPWPLMACSPSDQVSIDDTWSALRFRPANE